MKWKTLSTISAYCIPIWLIIFDFILEDDKYLYFETVGYGVFLTTFILSEFINWYKKRA